MSLAATLAALLLCASLAASQSQAYDPGASSETGCDPVNVSKPFSIFGDYADYALVDGGHFESGLGDWSLYGAGLVSGNESYYVNSAADGNSLAIPMFGKAVSGRFCVDYRYPHFRFFARLSEGSYGLLWVRAHWTEGDDVEHKTLGFLAGSDHRAWKPSDMLPLAERLSLTDGSRTQHVRLVFTSLAGNWQIDDVYVDPYRR